ncbi:MAG: hypothetical protein AAB463_00220 [Patescibacteria group bacterium]
MKQNKQQGSIIVFTVLLLSVMMTIVLASLGGFAVTQRSAAQVTEAAVALFGADSAAEFCLYEARRGPADLVFVDPDISYELIDIATDTPLSNCENQGIAAFRAQGIYRGTGRALELGQ